MKVHEILNESIDPALLQAAATLLASVGVGVLGGVALHLTKKQYNKLKIRAARWIVRSKYKEQLLQLAKDPIMRQAVRKADWDLMADTLHKHINTKSLDVVTQAWIAFFDDLEARAEAGDEDAKKLLGQHEDAFLSQEDDLRQQKDLIDRQTKDINRKSGKMDA